MDSGFYCMKKDFHTQNIRKFLCLQPNMHDTVAAKSQVFVLRVLGMKLRKHENCNKSLISYQAQNPRYGTMSFDCVLPQCCIQFNAGLIYIINNNAVFTSKFCWYSKYEKFMPHISATSQPQTMK